MKTGSCGPLLRPAFRDPLFSHHSDWGTVKEDYDMLRQVESTCQVLYNGLGNRPSVLDS